MMTLKFLWRVRGHHAHVDVFVGPAGGTLAKAGTLVLYPHEMRAFAKALEERRDRDARSRSRLGGTLIDEPPKFEPGARVRVTFAGRTVEATVVLASRNGRSVLLEFEAILGGYAGLLPLLWVDGAFRELMDDPRTATIEKLSGGEERHTP
jgi:hypothetical protein